MSRLASLPPPELARSQLEPIHPARPRPYSLDQRRLVPLTMTRSADSLKCLQRHRHPMLIYYADGISVDDIVSENDTVQQLQKMPISCTRLPRLQSLIPSHGRPVLRSPDGRESPWVGSTDAPSLCYSTFFPVDARFLFIHP